MNQETKQLTAQQWAMYIGQDIQYPGVDDELIIATLTGVSQSEGLETTYKKRKAGEPSGDIISFKSNGWHNSDALHAKPLLRPLSDITEEEARELGFADKRSAVYCFTPTNKEDGPYLYTRELAYLLSKGFDLWDWIESGLAIDKTKATN